MQLLSWRPKKKHIKDTKKPDFVPDWVYTEAQAAKFFYNDNWEYWVYCESQKHNTPIPETEDACIRGIKKEFLKMRMVYGDKIGQWFEDFMEMGDIFSKVKKWPEFLPKLEEGPNNG